MLCNVLLSLFAQQLFGSSLALSLGFSQPSFSWNDESQIPSKRYIGRYALKILSAVRCSKMSAGT